MKKYKYIFIFMITLFLLVIYFRYLNFIRVERESTWVPSMVEPQQTIFFETKWGFMGIGLQRASDDDGDSFNKGFTNFCIRGGKVYIADTVKSEIAVFDSNKLIRSYQYSPDIIEDLGLAVSNNFAFIFDIRGYLSKIDLSNGESKIRKLVLSRKDSKALTLNEYTLYMINDVIVLNDSSYMNKCFTTTDLTEIPCPFTSRRDPKYRTRFIYLEDNHYAGIIGGSDAWLYNSNDKRIGRVADINGDKLLYDMRRSYQVDLEGVYFVAHSDSGVRIYFKAWQKGHE